MITDAQLAEYIEGEMSLEARQRFETAAAADDKLIAQLVAQERVHHALQFLDFSPDAEPDPKLKHAIMVAACGGQASNANPNAPTEGKLPKLKPKVILAAIAVALMALLEAAIWFGAPRP